MTSLLSKYVHSFISLNSRKNTALFKRVLLAYFNSPENHYESTQKSGPQAWTQILDPDSQKTRP